MIFFLMTLIGSRNFYQFIICRSKIISPIHKIFFFVFCKFHLIIINHYFKLYLLISNFLQLHLLIFSYIYFHHYMEHLYEHKYRWQCTFIDKFMIFHIFLHKKLVYLDPTVKLLHLDILAICMDVSQVMNTFCSFNIQVHQYQFYCKIY